jgi:hypothetical protein
MPFMDVKPEDPHFRAVQRIGATGILKGTGVPYKWANQTWFYLGHPVSEYELITGLKAWYPQLAPLPASGKPLTLAFFGELLKTLKGEEALPGIASDWPGFGFTEPPLPDLQLNRGMAAVLTDHYLNPFAVPVDFTGRIISIP